MQENIAKNPLTHYLKKSFSAYDLLPKNKSHQLLKNASSSYVSLAFSSFFDELNHSQVYIFHNKEDALYALNECEDLLGKENVLYFPHSYLQPYQTEETQNANIVLRAEVLRKLAESGKNYVIVTYAKAIHEKVIAKKILSEQIFHISVDDKLTLNFLRELLFSYHFKHTDFVSQAGEFSVRGGILDIFSFGDEFPVRLSFFGDEVESIRKFNIETQLSVEKLKQFSLIPNIDQIETKESKISFFSYLPENTIYILKDFPQTLQSVQKNFQLAESIYQTEEKIIKRQKPETLFITEQEILQALQQSTTYEIGLESAFQNPEIVAIKQTEIPSFQKNFQLLVDDLTEKRNQNYSIFISFNAQKQAERLQSIFTDLNAEISFVSIFNTISEGFIDTENKFLVYTDHQIFERYHAYKTRNAFAKSEALTLKELTDYKIGDYITHIDHGIGKFMGLQRINNNGKVQEAIKIVYQNNDILYVNIHSLHKISRFNGKDGKEIVLNKLGSPAWKNLKNKTKKRVKEVAFDLIQLYAKRKTKKGFAFSPDGYLQNELEASFMYEETPDQLKATNEVKIDMEKPTAMDRLICGDVGFGKTEVAIRAAFKAATDGKQVAILAPTTILAFQHYNTFKKRLADFPVSVEYINRFRSAKDVKIIKEKLAEGKIEIIIGTHQLVSKDIQFKELGLLVVDEEHKFGVAVKDKLKTIKTNVDTLTLTATPIPRTLQFSLMSARDMSVIKTPPPNRQPINTQLIGFNEELIRDAILYEMQRDGQVFFLNNRIENLPEIAGMIQRLVPEARIAIGHGQMEGKKMEEILLQFMRGEKDVLLSTTIIESGLDVPNANTIFINNAHQFGLADLHQMRGRVGRSNRKAFCYLIAPPISVLTNEARKRLEAITQFSDLGSGFYIAMKDLEIRGAGDLLGGEQSGFINEMGFDAYQKILQEAVEELKNEDFAELFQEENNAKNYISEVTIDTDLALLIPDFYVNNVEERFALYQRLAEINTEIDLQSFENELIDRFGALPEETENLLKSIQLKTLAKALGFEKIVLKNEVLLCYFVNDEKSKFYESEKFQHILQFLQQFPAEAHLKQKLTAEGNTLYLRKSSVKNILSVEEFLRKILG